MHTDLPFSQTKASLHGIQALFPGSRRSPDANFGTLIVIPSALHAFLRNTCCNLPEIYHLVADNMLNKMNG